MSLDSERTFTYNRTMARDTSENTLRSRIRNIAQFYKKNARMPSFSEIGAMTGLKSKNAVFKLVGRLEKLKVLGRDKKGRLIPGSIASPVRVLGTIEAGFPSPAEEELVDTLSLDDLLIQNREATFLLKVSGDSMSGAGILPGDMVIVDKGGTAKSGDIVIAEPKALIGFAGPRVIEQTVRQKLPEGFQRAEFLVERGQVDRVVNRAEIPAVLGSILVTLMKGRARSKRAAERAELGVHVAVPVGVAQDDEAAEVLRVADLDDHAVGAVHPDGAGVPAHETGGFNPDIFFRLRGL